jgi:catechol 2,3-dioxygenase-like lactoylglutathione lyase family enzyme
MPTPLLVPEFEVSDIEKTKNIYIEIFGFHIGYDRPEEKFAYMERGDIHIMLEEVSGVGRRFNHVPLDYPYGRGVNFQIEIDDVDVVWERVQRTDLKICLPIEERWYRMDSVELGNRQFVVFDPDGYMLRFFTDIGERPA